MLVLFSILGSFIRRLLVKNRQIKQRFNIVWTSGREVIITWAINPKWKHLKPL